jgi:hypothetical protein
MNLTGTLILSLILTLGKLYSQQQAPVLQSFPIVFGLNAPSGLVATPDGRLLVTQMNGQIRVVQDLTLLPQPMLNISAQADGIFGIALHPNFTQNGYVFIHFVDIANQNSVYTRYTIDPANANLLLPNSAQEIFRIPYTAAGHRGGHIGFGPDGYLCIATGDAAAGARGTEGDPQALAQQPNNYYGKLLRIDIDQSLPYTIPPDNPYITNNQGFLPEIWAIGLRNPFSWSFGPNGKLYIGDNGNDQYDELNITDLPTCRAGNFGWPCFEGPVAYNSTSLCQAGISHLAPQHSFQGYNLNGQVGFSVMGGLVYNKTRYLSMQNHYIFGDYQSGGIYSLNTQLPNATPVLHSINIPTVTGFAQTDLGVFASNFSAGQLHYIYVNKAQSVKNGNWDDPLTWNCGCQPNSSYEVQVEAAHTITVSGHKTLSHLNVLGQLNLQNAATVSSGNN